MVFITSLELLGCTSEWVELPEHCSICYLVIISILTCSILYYYLLELLFCFIIISIIFSSSILMFKFSIAVRHL